MVAGTAEVTIVRCSLLFAMGRADAAVHVENDQKAIGGIDASLKERKGDPVQAELDSAMKRIGELTMQVELLEAKTETSGPLGRRKSRR